MDAYLPGYAVKRRRGFVRLVDAYKACLKGCIFVKYVYKHENDSDTFLVITIWKNRQTYRSF